MDIEQTYRTLLISNLTMFHDSFAQKNLGCPHETRRWNFVFHF